MIFPISDDDRHLLRPAYVSIGLVVMNVLVFLWQQLHPEFIYGWSVIPREISTGQDIVGSVVMPSCVLHLLESPSPVYLTVSGAGTFSASGEESGGVAYAAHIGGFVAGLAMGLVARLMMKAEPDTVFRRQYEREPGVKRYW